MRDSRCLYLCLMGLALSSSGMAGFPIVTNTNDAGPGSLRQAILDANATAGLNLIEFALPGPNYTIRPGQPLPVITEPVHIAGYTQPGSTPNTLEDGNNAQILVTIDGRDNINAYGLKLVGGDSIIEGLAVYGVQFGPAVLIEDKGGNTLYGNRFGTVLKDADLKNDTGIEIRNASGNTIGGPEPFQANRIIGNLHIGTYLENSDQNLIQKNEISGNKFNGVRMKDCDQNQLYGNLISDSSLGNGIALFNSSDNFIGDGTAENANTLTGNTYSGVVIDERGQQNLVAINRIFDNEDLGINLVQAPIYDSGVNFGFYSSVTPNDLAPDADEGGNQLQNFPILERAERSGSGLVSLQGKLTSAADTTYRIDVYANAEQDRSGHGEGQFHMATFTVTTNSGGNASFEKTLSTQPGLHISATATDPLNNTSEFSPSVPVRASTITVSSLNPDGPGTLAEAVALANATDTSEGYVVIEFDVPEDTLVIDLLDELVITNDRVFLDGYGLLRQQLFEIHPDYLTQRGVWLEGENSASGTGLDMRGNEGIIEGVGFNNFSGPALKIRGSGNSVGGNSFGGPSRNSSKWGNGIGVEVNGGTDNRIGGTVPSLRNIFDGNGQTGIRLRGLPEVPVEATSIRGNRIENTGGPGIRIENATGTRVGGWSLGSGNIMRYNAGPGVEDDGTDTTQVGGNSIHNNTGLPFDIGGDGETPNDTPDTDGNPNYPGVSSAIISGDGRTIALAGSLTTPVGFTTTAWIGAFLADGHAAEDGGRYVGGAPLVTDNDGQTDLTLEIELPADQLSDGSALRFIASSDAFGSSEYSPVTVASQQESNLDDLVIEFTDAGSRLDFDTTFGRSYTAWKTTDPATTPWEPVATSVAGTGDRIEITDPQAFEETSNLYVITENAASGVTGTLETVTLKQNNGWPTGFDDFLRPTLNDPGQVAFIARSGTLPEPLLAPLWQVFIRDQSGGLQPVLTFWIGSNFSSSEFVTIPSATLDRTAPYPISNSGLVAGTATFFGDNIGDPTAMEKFAAGPENLNRFMRDGTKIPKVPSDGDNQRLFWEQGGQFSMPVRINDSGDVVFGGAYRIENNFSFAGSGIHNRSGVIVRNGYPIPGYEPEVFRGVGGAVINDAGRIIFNGSRLWGDGVDRYNDGLLVAQTRNTFQVYWAEGDLAPGFPETATKETRLSHTSPGGTPFEGLQFNKTGQIAFAAALGDVDPDPNSGPPTVYSQYLRGEGREGIYVTDTLTLLTLVTAQGQPATLFESPSSFINALSYPVLSNSGKLAFTASYGPDHVYVTGKGLFVYDSKTETTRRIYKTGDVVDGLPPFGPTGLFQSINEVRLVDDHNRIAVNDSGAVAFMAGFTEGTQEGLFYVDPDGAILPIAVEGQPFEIPSTGATKTILSDNGIRFQGGSNSSGQPVGFNNAGQVAFALFFTDGDAGIFLFTPPGEGL